MARWIAGRVVQGLVAVTVTMPLLSGCEPATAPATELNEAVARQEFIAQARAEASVVGRLHNEALREAYRRLHAARRASPQGLLSKLTIAHTLADTCAEFLGSRSLDTGARQRGPNW